MAGNIVLITPGSGYQQVSSEELNSTLEAVAGGQTLSTSQQTIANALQSAAPRQGNVFSGGSPSSSQVQPVAKDSPVAPVPQVLGTKDAPQDFRGFLAGLSPSQTGTALGGPVPKVSPLGPVSAAFDVEALKSLLFPPEGPSIAAQGGGSTLGDATLSEEVENMRLNVEKSDLEQRRQNQILAEQVRRGIVPSAARVTNQLGQPLVNLSGIGLTQQQVNATRTRKTIDDLLGPRRSSVIGTPRLPSIIAR